MMVYKNLSGISGVREYETSEQAIRVRFHDGWSYLYTYSSASRAEVEEMKKLAELGRGLNTFINVYVRARYESKSDSQPKQN